MKRKTIIANGLRGNKMMDLNIDKEFAQIDNMFYRYMEFQKRNNKQLTFSIEELAMISGILQSFADNSNVFTSKERILMYKLVDKVNAYLGVSRAVKGK